MAWAKKQNALYRARLGDQKQAAIVDPVRCGMQVNQSYHIRVLVPCYKESFDIVTRTIMVCFISHTLSVFPILMPSFELVFLKHALNPHSSCLDLCSTIGSLAGCSHCFILLNCHTHI